MSTKPEPGATLPCEQCGYANEPERVYCHNCGSKLDRSLLPKAAEKPQEHPEKARKRIEKMTNPKSGGVLREIKTLFKVAFFAALVAVVLLVIQKPVDLPDLKKKDDPRLVSSDLMEALGAPKPTSVSFSDDDINHYLEQTIKPKDTMVPGVQVVHAYVTCEPGVLHIYMEQSVLGLPLFSRIDYRIEVKNGKFTPHGAGRRLRQAGDRPATHGLRGLLFRHPLGIAPA